MCVWDLCHQQYTADSALPQHQPPNLYMYIHYVQDQLRSFILLSLPTGKLMNGDKLKWINFTWKKKLKFNLVMNVNFLCNNTESVQIQTSRSTIYIIYIRIYTFYISTFTYFFSNLKTWNTLMRLKIVSYLRFIFVLFGVNLIAYAGQLLDSQFNILFGGHIFTERGVLMTYVSVNPILVVFSVLSSDPNLDYVGAGAAAPLNGGCAAVCAVPRSIHPRPRLLIPRIRHCLTSMVSKGAQLLSSPHILMLFSFPQQY